MRALWIVGSSDTVHQIINVQIAFIGITEKVKASTDKRLRVLTILCTPLGSRIEIPCFLLGNHLSLGHQLEIKQRLS